MEKLTLLMFVFLLTVGLAIARRVGSIPYLNYPNSAGRRRRSDFE